MLAASPQVELAQNVTYRTGHACEPGYYFGNLISVCRYDHWSSRVPRRKTQTKDGTRKALQNSAYERRVAAWLMQDGWQVFTPMLDHGHRTDILISDGPNYYRIQIKTVEAKGENHVVVNCWKDSNVDLVIYFARNSTWGVIAPAFPENKRRLNHETHRKFTQNKKDFLREFHKFD